MVSRCIVLFGITYLRLEIFITWRMSIFQSTVVLRHIFVCFLSHTRASPPSLGSSDLPQTSFTFWFSRWLLRVAYWGIPSFLRIIKPFPGFGILRPSCRSSWVVILRHIPSGRVYLHHYLSYPLALGHLIRSFIILSVQLEFGVAPILIDHLPIISHQFEFDFLSQDRTYIDRSFIVSVWVGAAPISIGHLPISLSLSF